MSEKRPEPPLPPLATGIALGVWVAVMLLLGFVVVPTAFAACQRPA